MTALRQLDDSLWVAEAPLRVLGVQAGRRMTVIRFDSGDLFIHSPAPLDRELRASLDALGTVRYLAAASLLHGHLSMGDYARAYSRAELLAPPGLRERRKDLTFAGDLGDTPDMRWAFELDQTPLEGNRFLTEILFHHRRSRTLIVGDAVWNNTGGLGLAARIWAGGRRRVAPTPAFRLAINDRNAARASLKLALEWDFDRLIVGHGPIVETGGKAAFQGGYSWLLPTAPST
jgi:hypothetical protein